MDLSRIPAHMVPAVENYVFHGIIPGHFLQAILQNQLTEAFMRADDINRECMKDWAAFLFWEMPQGSWGSKEIVKQWAKDRRTSPSPINNRS